MTALSAKRRPNVYCPLSSGRYCLHRVSSSLSSSSSLLLSVHCLQYQRSSAFISLGRIIVVNRLGVDDGKDNVKGEERPPRFSCGGGRCRVCNIGHAPRQLQIRTSVTPDMQVGKFGTRQLSWDRARSRAIGTPSSENRMDGGDSYGCSRPVPSPHLPWFLRAFASL